MYNLSHLSHEFPALALSSIDANIQALKTARDRYSHEQNSYNKDQVKAALLAAKSSLSAFESDFNQSLRPLRERMGR